MDRGENRTVPVSPLPLSWTNAPTNLALFSLFVIHYINTAMGMGRAALNRLTVTRRDGEIERAIC